MAKISLARNLSDLVMGYRDDFYIAENIIGYTGTATLHPTVYFKYQYLFGHITQNHRNPQNIGRTVVYWATDYCAMNYSKEITDPAILEKLTPRTTENGRMFEFYHGEVRHKSRDQFIPVQNLNTTLSSQLFIAIHSYPRMKIKDIKCCIELYRRSCSDKTFFSSRVTPYFDYREVEDLKGDIEYSCEGENMYEWLARHS